MLAGDRVLSCAMTGKGPLMGGLQVFNTNGAARRLGCTRTWIHKLVAAGKLKAYVYDEAGVLVPHQPERKRQGQGLYFVVEDLEQYESSLLRRAKGGKGEDG